MAWRGVDPGLVRAPADPWRVPGGGRFRLHEARAMRSGAVCGFVRALVVALLALSHVALARQLAGGADDLAARLRESVARARDARATGDDSAHQRAIEAACAALDAAPRDLAPEEEQLVRELGLEALRSRLGAAAVGLLRRAVDEFAAHRDGGDLELDRLRLNLGTALRVAGDLVGARTEQEAALLRIERAHPNETQLLHNARRTLAQTCSELGDIAAEVELRTRIVDALGPDAGSEPARWDAELELAAVLAVAGRIETAREVQARVSTVLTSDLPGLDPLRAQAFLVDGLLLLAEGRPDLAESAFTRSASHAASVDEGLRLRASTNLGIAMLRQGDPAGALRVLDGVLAAEVARHGSDHPAAHHARVNLVEPARQVGDLRRAHALSAESLAGLERALPAGHRLLRAARVNRALVLRDLDDVPQARFLLEEEVALGPMVGHSDLDARRALALVLADSDETARAIALLEDVLDEHRRGSDSQATASSAACLAAIVRDEDPRRARELEREALELYGRELPATHPLVTAVRANLAVTELELHEFDAAHATLLQVLAEREQSLPADHPLVLQSIRNVVWSHARAGRIEEARAAATRLARSLVAAAAAWPSWLAPREVEQRVASTGEDVSTLLSISIAVRGAPADPALDRAAFDAIEALRFTSEVATRAPGGSVDDAAGIRAAAADLARIAASGGDARDLAAARRTLDALQRSAASAPASARRAPDRATIAARLGEGRAWVAYRVHTRAHFQMDGSLEEEERLAAFVLRGDGALTRVDLGPADRVDSAVEAWREAIAVQRERGLATPEVASEERAGRELRRLVLDPLDVALSGADVVAIAPDGALHFVPFDALPLDEEGSRAGDTRSLCVVEGAGDLAGDRTPLGAGALLLVGDLDFDRPAAESRGAAPGAWDPAFLRLPASGAEIDSIAQYHATAFGDAAVRSVLRGVDATRAALESRAPGAAYVHFATHGWFAPESVPAGRARSVLDAGAGVLASDAREAVRSASPLLLCGLALSGANAAADGLGPPRGRISGEEIAALDLRACRLAVLSACETGLGVRRAGLSIASLRSAFHRAGAQSLVTSLWRVPDEATRDLVTDTYRRIWIQGHDPRSALWAAKLRLRRAVDPSGRPLHGVRDWAAWVMSGPLDG